MLVDRIRELLKEKNIFAKDMLAELGINKDQLKRWEDPNATIKPIYLNAIAAYLGTTPEYLLGQSDDKDLPLEELKGLDEKDTEILNMYSRLSDEQKKQALSYLEFLADKQENEDKQ